MKTARQSGLEFLRIIAMLMIVAAHLSQRGLWIWNETDTALTFNQFLMNIVICFGQVGVAIFFSITGYFIYNSGQYNWRRVFKVARPTWFYSLIFLALSIIFVPTFIQFTWPLDNLVARSIFPIMTNSYWFISAYIVLYLLIPYIKIWLDNLSDKKLSQLILLVAGVFILPNFISYIVADSTSLIFAIPAALFYAITGYAVHRFQKKLQKISSFNLILMHFSGVILYVVASVLIRLATTRLGYHNINNNILIDTMSLPCMLTSIPLVILCTRWNFKNKIINYIAGLVFGVYLIHSNGYFIKFVWQEHDLLRTAAASSYSSLHFLIYFIATVLIIFCSCALIEAVRKMLVAAVTRILQRRAK